MIGQVGNYVIANRSDLGNFMIADTLTHRCGGMTRLASDLHVQIGERDVDEWEARHVEAEVSEAVGLLDGVVRVAPMVHLAGRGSKVPKLITLEWLRRCRSAARTRFPGGLGENGQADTPMSPLVGSVARIRAEWRSRRPHRGAH